MKKLKVKYDGPMNPALDSELKKVIEQHGYDWYAQGTDLTTGERDIAFSTPANPADDPQNCLACMSGQEDRRHTCPAPPRAEEIAGAHEGSNK